MPIRRILVSTVAVTALLLMASPSPADTFRIKAQGEPGTFHWQPDFRHINKGDRIVWKNPTSATHTVTAYSGPWDKNTAIGPGERTAKTFRKTGT